MKKKLVIITEALGGGVRRHVVSLLENLDKDKFDIYFMYNLGRADEVMKKRLPSIKDLGVKLIEIDNFKRDIGLHDVKAFMNIYKELKKIKPDIVHCHSSKAGVLGRIAGKLARIRKIYYTPHAYIMQNPNTSKNKKIVFESIERLLSRYFTTKTINVSNGEKQFAIESKIDKDGKFEVIYNGICDIEEVNNETKDRLRKEFKINTNDFIIGTIARMDEQKNPDLFIDIAKSVLKECKNVKFIYVGDGKLYEHISRRVLDEDINESVILTGFRSDTDEILSIFDLFLTTALYEGMPYALIEACRAGVPIVATDVIGNNEIVINEKNGMIYDINNIEMCTKKICKVFCDSTRKSLSRHARDRFNQNFNIVNMILKLEKMYFNKEELVYEDFAYNK